MIFQDYDYENCNSYSGNIPITGMDSVTHVIIFGVVVPFIVSIFLALIFARFITPLFINLKNKALARKYETAYFERKPQPFNKKTMIKRIIFANLLALGLCSFLFGVLDLEQWTSPEKICDYGSRGLDYTYNIDTFLPIFGIAYTLGIGIWSVSWALEDSGLMHYVFRDNDYFEIEPVYVRFNTYVKGYAGVGSLLFLVEWVMEQLNNSFDDAMFIFAILLVGIACFFPCYFIYAKVLKNHDYLKKGMQEMKKLTIDDLAQ